MTSLKFKPQDKYKIGIDPDIDKSGVAIMVDTAMQLKTLTFFELQDLLINTKAMNIPFTVYIEAGWLNKYNFSARKAPTESSMLKIGNNTGMNFAVGMLLEKFCIRLNIDCRLVKPLRRIWGKDKKQKISHKEFIRLERIKNMCSNLQKTNQEQRDAALLII
jgi:hypothetical protein